MVSVRLTVVVQWYAMRRYPPAAALESSLRNRSSLFHVVRCALAPPTVTHRPPHTQSYTIAQPLTQPQPQPGAFTH